MGLDVVDYTCRQDAPSCLTFSKNIQGVQSGGGPRKARQEWTKLMVEGNARWQHLLIFQHFDARGRPRGPIIKKGGLHTRRNNTYLGHGPMAPLDQFVFIWQHYIRIRMDAMGKPHGSFVPSRKKENCSRKQTFKAWPILLENRVLGLLPCMGTGGILAPH